MSISSLSENGKDRGAISLSLPSLGLWSVAGVAHRWSGRDV
jgi:hypothetical protein